MSNDEVEADDGENQSPEQGTSAADVTDLSNIEVCTKYQEAAKIVNATLEGLVGQCVPGAKVIDLCQFGTDMIQTLVSKLYSKKVNGQTVDRGVAFPVCISVNEIVCNHSPLASEERPPLKAGDVVKMDLGCHIDGYIAVAAHTCVVAESADAKPVANEALGNLAVAAYNAMLVAASTIVAGASNTDVTKAVERVAKSYGVTPISSVRMHQMKRYVLDGVKEVALKTPTPDELEMEEKLPQCTFEQAEVYAVDVAMSTGDGKAKPAADIRTTVFKRNVETQYRLKMKASRTLLSEVDKKYPTLPFTLRHFSDERQARMGITECVAHGLLTPYPSLQCSDGQVAHFKCTVLLLPNGTVRVTGLDLPDYFTSTCEPDEETKSILAQAIKAATDRAKKAAKRKKKKTTTPGAATAAAAIAEA